jgi:hypothetical protein
MKRCVLALLALAICGLLGGCSTASDNTTTTNATNTNAAGTTNAAKTSTTNTTTSTTSASTAGNVGVTECDEFIAKYEKCVNSNIPEAARATFKTTMETWRKTWRDAAATPAGKAGLAQACKTSLETAKQSMAAYKCEW